MSIRIVNTRTGRTTEARDGRDAAHIVKIEQDRRSGIEASEAKAHAEQIPASVMLAAGAGR